MVDELANTLGALLRQIVDNCNPNLDVQYFSAKDITLKVTRGWDTPSNPQGQLERGAQTLIKKGGCKLNVDGRTYFVNRVTHSR